MSWACIHTHRDWYFHLLGGYMNATLESCVKMPFSTSTSQNLCFHHILGNLYKDQLSSALLSFRIIYDQHSYTRTLIHTEIIKIFCVISLCAIENAEFLNGNAAFLKKRFALILLQIQTSLLVLKYLI